MGWSPAKCRHGGGECWREGQVSGCNPLRAPALPPRAAPVPPRWAAFNKTAKVWLSLLCSNNQKGLH